MSYPARAEGLVNMDKAVNSFSLGIIQKVNVIGSLEFEPVYFEAAVPDVPIKPRGNFNCKFK